MLGKEQNKNLLTNKARTPALEKQTLDFKHWTSNRPVIVLLATTLAINSTVLPLSIHPNLDKSNIFYGRRE
jgi:hypothetical protein